MKAMQQEVDINPAILTWARDKAGLTEAEAAKKIGLQSSGRSSAVEKLKALESGEKKLTRSRLLKIAKIYHQPSTTFYRSTPPPEEDWIVDFRTLSGRVTKREAALLDTLLHDFGARQDLTRAILEDDEDWPRLGFVGSLSVDEPVSAAVERIRQILKISDGSDPWVQSDSPRELFSNLRRRVEGAGVFVILAGNLGSYHTDISEKVFRGFVISDDIAPFIVLNPHDAISARSFTLIHELAHIFVGSTGISAMPAVATPHNHAERTERFCNDVASEFLLPANILAESPKFRNAEEASRAIRELAEARNVSGSMVAYRYWRTGQISDTIYRHLSSRYSDWWQEAKKRKRAQGGKGGPNYYTTRKHALGDALLTQVGQALRSEDLTRAKAAIILGVNIGNVTPLLKTVRGIYGSGP